ncbi:MAG: SPFH domain-containing protein [Puniceicoccales bacterium]
MMPLAIILGVLAVIVALALLCYRAPRSSEALVRTGLGGAKVSLGGMFALPGLQTCATLDLSLSRLALSYRGPENPLITKGEQLFDLEVTIYFRAAKTPEEIALAVAHFGLDTLNDEAALVAVVRDDMDNAVRAAAGEFNWDEIRDEPQRFKEGLSQRLAPLIPGLVVDGIALDHIDKFPPEISARQGGGLLFRAL